jgi:DNA-binding NarL/FixJ family response regulator
MKKHLSILIVDDHDTIASGLKFELQNTDFISVISIAENAEDAVEYCNIISFDLGIIDISFKNETNTDGIGLAKILKKKFPHMQLIIYSSYAERIPFINRLKDIQVEAIVSKVDGNKSIKEAINNLMEKKIPYYSPLVAECIKNENSKGKNYISNRERDVILLLQQHLTYKEIAKQLGISKNTVDFHAKNLYSKFGVHKVSELLEKVKDFL